MGGSNFESVLYEGYGPGGVAILVDALTDNRNRTAGEVRLIFDKHNGAVGAANSVGWMFSKKGGDQHREIKNWRGETDGAWRLDAGAEDVVTSDEGYEVTTTLQAFEKVRLALVAAKVDLAQADIMMIPSQTVSTTGRSRRKIAKNCGRS